MFLSIDVESSGLPAHGSDIADKNYPWPVQIGAVLFDNTGRDHGTFGARIRCPDGKHITPGASAVHGITTKDASRSGLSEITALGVVCGFAASAQYLIGFNVEFDRDILCAALVRLGKDTRTLLRPGLQVIDTMKPSAPFCARASGREDGQYKWPRLDDAVSTIRNERPRHGHHDALRDAQATKRLFLSLLHRGALDMEAA